MISAVLLAAIASTVTAQTTPGTLTTSANRVTTNGNTVANPSGPLTTTCWCACDGLDRFTKLTGEKPCNEVAVCDSCGSCSNGYGRACSQGFLCKDTSTSASVTNCAFLQCGATDDCACRGLTIQCALERGCTVEPELKSRCSTACSNGKPTNGDAKNCTAVPVPTTAAGAAGSSAGSAASALEIKITALFAVIGASVAFFSS